MLTFQTKTKPVPQNRKLRRGKGSRLFLDKDFSTTWNAIQSEWRSQYSGEPLSDHCYMLIEFGWSRMDIDSCIKPIMDYLQGIAYTNDKQVIGLTIKRIDSPIITVTIST